MSKTDAGTRREALVQMVIEDRDVIDRSIYEEALEILAREVDRPVAALAVEIEQEAHQRSLEAPSA